ncbi:hypothetical protein MLD38_011242 [Melastoma candidum]|uniref:Uncharacterized protein n=1 Tax=Melastoma candidum TaxID=119954 RepID=A0ACB9R2I4_9MYRT|nr:hypothetical protein MLD38_011242 [Melastoma candidum]
MNSMRMMKAVVRGGGPLPGVDQFALARVVEGSRNLICLPGMSKRKRPELAASGAALTEHEKTLYSLIRSKQDMGIWSKDLKQEAKIPDNAAMKALKSLISKGLVKEVVNVHFKARKHCMAAEFEPSAEITGGPWYNQGSLDTEFIDIMKDQCLRLICKLGVATVDMVADEIKRSRILKADYQVQQIGEIVKALALDNDIVEVKSTGIGEFASIQPGKSCYKCLRLPGASKEPSKVVAMASVPCGVCPHLRECTPGGIISPTTCDYFTKWLDF